MLKILEKNKAARLVADAALVTKQRQSRLRVAHQTLRAAEPDADKRSSFPIFGDFLNLPSVVPFWEPIDATFVQIQWDAVVSDIQLEVTEHRESTRIHAIKQILLSTTDASEEDLDDYDTSYDAATHGDQFFSTATSFLFCTLPNCRHKPRHRYRWYGYGGMSHNPSRTTFFGSLPDILAHQHELHGDQRFDDPSDGHFELPEILADVLASLADAINVERDEVLPKDLDGYYYKWTSATSKPGKYWEWRDLVRPRLCRVLGSIMTRSRFSDRRDPPQAGRAQGQEDARAGRGRGRQEEALESTSSPLLRFSSHILATAKSHPTSLKLLLCRRLARSGWTGAFARRCPDGFVFNKSAFIVRPETLMRAPSACLSRPFALIRGRLWASTRVSTT